MTPPCCTQAWAKATGTKELFPCEGDCTFGGCPHWFTSYGNFPNTRCPAPTSAEWLADIVEASMYLEQKFGPLEEGEDAPIEVSIRFMGPSRLRGVDITLRRALCAALNGKACERKAA